MKFLRILSIIFFVKGLITGILPSIMWFKNPHLTMIQLLIEYWWIYLLSLGFLAIAAYSHFITEERKLI